MSFRLPEVRRSKMLISTNRNTDGTYPAQSFTNTLLNNGSPVTSGAAYSITAKPDGLTNQITVNPSTGEVTFGAAALTKVNTDGPQTVTVQAAHQGKTASYTFTVTDHFSGRISHSSVVLRREGKEDIYVIGGTSQTSPILGLDDVWRSSDGGLTWDQVDAEGKRFTPMRLGHSSVTLDNDIYVMAGFGTGSTSAYRDDVWKSTDRGVSWTQAASSDSRKRFIRRYYASAQVFKGAIYLMGGLSAGAQNTVWTSADGGRTWRNLLPPSSDRRFTPRNSHSSVVLGEGDAAELYVIGGRGTGTTRFNDVWKSADGGSWSEVAVVTPFTPARGGHTLASVKDGIHAGLYLIAGESATAKLGDVWKSIDQGENWARVTSPSTPAPFGIRAGHTSVVRGTTMYVIGGSEDDGATLYNDVWKSDDGGATWVNVHKNP